MNYNKQYEHITVKLSSSNLSIMLWYTYYCTKQSLAYKFYKDNRLQQIILPATDHMLV